MFAASLLMCTILFGFIYTCLGCIERSGTDGCQEYLTFLSGYWMTAPLAWSHAFPIETMTDELPSIYFNLTALSVVSIWRVLLFARIVSIQFAIPYLSSLSWVLVLCMAVAFVALISAMQPMVAVMCATPATDAASTGKESASEEQVESGETTATADE